MPRINVYLPDALAVELAGHPDINVSSVCQRALREELDIMSAIAAAPEMERIEVPVEDPRTGIVRTAAFTGRWILPPSDDIEINGYVHAVAVTKKGRIAVWTTQGFGPGELRDFDSIDELENLYPDSVVADARAELTGSIATVELDI